MHLIDTSNLKFGGSVVRFHYNVAIEKETSMVAPDTLAWRQRAPFDKTYFQTAAGTWRRLKLWNKVDGIALETGKKAAVVLHSCRQGNFGSFPSIGQWGTGILWEAGDEIAYPAHNVLWYIDQRLDKPPDPQYMWIGGGAKYGGMVPVWGREALHGWIFNVADFSKRYYIQAEANRWGVGLGGGAGTVLLVVTGKDPSGLIGQVNGAWDFNLSVAGKWDQYIKYIAEGGKYAKYLELGKFAMAVYNKAGVIHKGAFEQAANYSKLVFSGLAIDWKSTSLTALDVAGSGLEASICFTQSKVTMVSPF
jgi:hypothetical protein